ncbi:MAG: ATP-binding cassette domain-containing protein [Candidatus Pacebacteria bacterium]|nr:ATP-binding cassette domain-containing protein [Candidatus Paceibacterota bacterium]
MIDFQNITKSFGMGDVLRDVTFRVNAGERVGVTGPNGAGKSTIFALITGEISPDSGSFHIPKDLRIGHLRQQLNPHEVKRSILEYAENALGTVQSLQRRIHDIESTIHAEHRKAKETELAELAELQHEFEHLGGYELRTRAEAALTGLGFNPTALDRPFQTLSGGWKMRAELARVLVAHPDILLLDEPTNYLDVPAVEWLTSFLEGWSGTLMLISHDRYLLNTLTGVTVEVANARATRYEGAYNHYVQERRQRAEQLAAAKKNQDRKRQQIERFVERFRAKSTKASQVQSRVRMLDKMDEIEVPPTALTPPRIHLPPVRRSGQEVVQLDDAGLSYDGKTWIFRKLDVTLERGAKAAVVAPNGTGKTSLLRVLAGTLELSEGRRRLGVNVTVGYQAQDYTDILHPGHTVFASAKRLSEAASDADTRSVLGGFGFSGTAVDKQVNVLSGGEKVRLAIATLLLRSPNFLVLDEPTTHLDIPSRQALENALREYPGTLCLVSHDIEFIRQVATTIFHLSPQGLVKYFGGYDYYREKHEAEKMTALQPAGAIEQQNDKKQRKREEARVRQLFAEQRRPHEEASRTAEQRIDELHAEQETLLEKLQNQPNAPDIAATTRRLGELQKELEQATQQWEQAELAIEDLRDQLGLN